MYGLGFRPNSTNRTTSDITANQPWLAAWLIFMTMLQLLTLELLSRGQFPPPLCIFMQIFLTYIAVFLVRFLIAVEGPFKHIWA